MQQENCYLSFAFIGVYLLFQKNTNCSTVRNGTDGTLGTHIMAQNLLYIYQNPYKSMRTYITLAALLCLTACNKDKQNTTTNPSATEIVTCNTTAMQVRFIGFTADELDTIVLKDYKQDKTFATTPATQQLNGLASDTLYSTKTTVSNVLSANLYKDYYYDIYIPATGKSYRISELYDDKETETITVNGKSGHYICYTHPSYAVVNNDTTLFEHVSNSAGYTHAYLQLKK